MKGVVILIGFGFLTSFAFGIRKWDALFQKVLIKSIDVRHYGIGPPISIWVLKTRGPKLWCQTPIKKSE